MPAEINIKLDSGTFNKQFTDLGKYVNKNATQVGKNFRENI